MAHQARIWSDADVRTERQPPAERFMGRTMDLDPLPEFKYVFRHRGPHYAKRCAIIARSRLSIDQWGSVVHHTGGEAVAIQFEDGTKIEAQRQQIILAGSKAANQVLAKAARGMTTMRDHRRNSGKP